MPTLDKEKLELLIGGNESAVSPGAFSDLEAIILTTGRPSLLVQDGNGRPCVRPRIKRRLGTGQGHPGGVNRACGAGRNRRWEPGIRRHRLDDRRGRDGHEPPCRSRFRRQAGKLLRVQERRRRPDAPGTHGLPEGVRARRDVRGARPRGPLHRGPERKARPDMALLRLERGNTGLPKPIEARRRDHRLPRQRGGDRLSGGGSAQRRLRDAERSSATSSAGSVSLPGRSAACGRTAWC